MPAADVRLAEVIQNRAVGPVIAMTVIGKVLQGSLHRLHFPYFGFQLGDVRTGQFFDFGAGSPGIIPEPQQLRYLLHRKTERARAFDKTQSVQIRIVVQAVIGEGAVGGGDQPDAFVMANHFGRYPGDGGGLSDIVKALDFCIR